MTKSPFSAAAPSDGPAVPEGREPAAVAKEPSDEELLQTYGAAKRDYCYEGDVDDWPKKEERAATVAGLRAVLARWGRPVPPPPPAEGEVGELVAWLQQEIQTASICGEKETSSMQARVAVLLKRQAAELERLRALAVEVSALVDESGGVAGLHLNGDLAPWDELLPGGRFERLTSLASREL